jgi:hypothetical protein
VEDKTYESPVQGSHTLVLGNLANLDERPSDLVTSGGRLGARLPNIGGGVESGTDETSDGTGDEVVPEGLAFGLVKGGEDSGRNRTRREGAGGKGDEGRGTRERTGG